ncbi:MAG: SpoIIE family protein phosphatase, partial [Actinomycetota bacterium]
PRSAAWPGHLAARRSPLVPNRGGRSERLGALAKRLTGATAALVSLVDADRQHFKCCLGLAEPWANQGETPLSHSICQHALTAPGPLVIPDTAADDRLADNLAVSELGAGAYLGIPLVSAEGHVLGSFCVLDREPRTWSDNDIAVMQDLAASVMAEIELRELLIERQQQAAVLQRSEGRLRSIMDGLFIFAGLLDTEGVLREANSAALEAAGLEPGDVIGRPFWETHWWSWDGAVQDQLRAAVRKASAGQLCRYDALVRLTDDLLLPIDFQLAPLVEDGEIVALIPSGIDITERKQFEGELQRLAGIEADHRERAERLLELSRTLSAAIDTGQVAAAVAGSQVAGAVFCNVALPAADGDELELWHGPQLEAAIGDRWPRIARDRSTPLGAAVVTGDPQLAGTPEEIAGEFPMGADDAEAAGLQALAAVPVKSAGGAVGFAWDRPVEFTPTLIDTLGLVADLAGQALERAAVNDRNRRVAERLQRSLLPAELPDIPGAVLVSRYVAGGAGLDVGGDWFDVGLLAPGRWVLAVGDVVGRGLNAAAVMGQLRTSFNALATNSADLQLLVERLDLAANDLDDSPFSTMVAVEYEPGSGALTTLSAGHPPPFVRRANGTVVRLEAAGGPLGLSVGEKRSPIHDRLWPGDALVLYTDGLIEQRSESIDAGLDRLADAMARLPPTLASSWCDRLLEELQPGPSDDVALLALVVDRA